MSFKQHLNGISLSVRKGSQIRRSVIRQVSSCWKGRFVDATEGWRDLAGYCVSFLCIAAHKSQSPCLNQSQMQ